MDRRAFLRNGLAATAGSVLLATTPAGATAARPGVGPYGSLDGRSPDRNGLVLPEGFTSRVVAVGGSPVNGTDYRWPVFPDGKGTVPMADGGWSLACNHEVFDFQTPGERWGGASAVRFAADGSITGASAILTDSHSNSRGATTPWGTWLSCQEAFGGDGLVWECDPMGHDPAVARHALGVRTHGSVAVDPAGGHCYLTEAHRDGRLYRFTILNEADSGAALADGLLEAMVVDRDGGVSWLAVPDPLATVIPTRVQVTDGFVTPVGGGVWVHDGVLLFTTALDDRVHAVDLAGQHHSVVWDGSGHRQPLVGIGDLTVHARSGDLFVVEDRGDMEVAVVSPEGEVAPFCRMVGADHRLSQATGPCFDPSGTRFYVSSLRGRGEALVRDMVPAIDWGTGAEGRHVGVTWEVSGPFRAKPSVILEGGPEVPSTTTEIRTSPATTTSHAIATTTPHSIATTTSHAVGTTTVATVEPGTPSPSTTLERAGDLSVSEGPVEAGGPRREPSGGLPAVGLGAAAVLIAGGAALVLRRRRSDR